MGKKIAGSVYGTKKEKTRRSKDNAETQRALRLAEKTGKRFSTEALREEH
jgi:hypothetical protein